MANDLIIRSKDRLQEISIKLEQSHLVYLQTDDSPLKLQQRHKLEGKCMCNNMRLIFNNFLYSRFY